MRKSPSCSGPYGLSDQEIAPILNAFQANPPAWVDFMMRYELGLEEPNPHRALTSALTIAGAYIGGGMIPLAPYMVLKGTHAAQLGSVGVTLTALLIFGYIKGRFTGARPIKSALADRADRRPGRRGGVSDRPDVLRTLGRAAQPPPSRLPRTPGGLVPGTITRSPAQIW